MTLLLLIYTIKQFYQRAAARAHDLTALRIWRQGRRRAIGATTRVLVVRPHLEAQVWYALLKCLRMEKKVHGFLCFATEENCASTSTTM